MALLIFKYEIDFPELLATHMTLENVPLRNFLPFAKIAPIKSAIVLESFIKVLLCKMHGILTFWVALTRVFKRKIKFCNSELVLSETSP